MRTIQGLVENISFQSVIGTIILSGKMPILSSLIITAGRVFADFCADGLDQDELTRFRFYALGLLNLHRNRIRYRSLRHLER